MSYQRTPPGGVGEAPRHEVAGGNLRGAAGSIGIDLARRCDDCLAARAMSPGMLADHAPLGRMAQLFGAVPGGERTTVNTYALNTAAFIVNKPSSSVGRVGGREMVRPQRHPPRRARSVRQAAGIMIDRLGKAARGAWFPQRLRSLTLPPVLTARHDNDEALRGRLA